MSVLIPLLYILLLSYLLTHIKWINKAGFGKRFTVLFFLTKCGAGFAYNYIALRFLPHQGDIWPFFEDGREMYRLFLQSPQAFYQVYGQIFRYSDFNATSTNSDFIRSAFEAIKLLHFALNFITLGNLWANTVIFNFGATLCFLYCWKFLKQQLWEQGLFAGAVFLLLPSVFFYSAGILKEGIVISLLCLLIPLSYKLLRRFSIKIAVSWFFLFAALFIIKIFVAALWMACLVLWWLLLLFPKKKKLLVSAALLVAVLLFFYGNYLFPAFDIPAYFIKRQQEFLALTAGSSIYIEPLTHQPLSYAKALPVAFNNVLFKPLPGEGGKALYSLYAVEMFFFWLGMAVLIWKRRKIGLSDTQSSLGIVFLLFAGLNLLFIGLIVPNIGSIIRYRSIFLPFVAVAAVIFCQPGFVVAKFNRILEKWTAR